MTAAQYLSFIEQTLHYFDRPHEAPASTPIVSPAAWRGDELPPLNEMAHHLTGQEVDEVPAEPHDIPLDWVMTERGSIPLFMMRAMAENGPDTAA